MVTESHDHRNATVQEAPTVKSDILPAHSLMLVNTTLASSR